MNIYRFASPLRCKETQPSQTRPNTSLFPVFLISHRMDEQHAFFVKNSPRIPRDRVSEDSHLFPPPLASSARLFSADERTKTGNNIWQRSFGGKENAPLLLYIYASKYSERMVGWKRERERERVDTYDITTSTWRIKRCTAYVMRDCRSACTTRDVLDSGLVFIFISLPDAFNGHGDPFVQTTWIDPVGSDRVKSCLKLDFWSDGF